MRPRGYLRPGHRIPVALSVRNDTALIVRIRPFCVTLRSYVVSKLRCIQQQQADYVPAAVAEREAQFLRQSRWCDHPGIANEIPERCRESKHWQPQFPPAGRKQATGPARNRQRRATSRPRRISHVNQSTGATLNGPVRFAFRIASEASATSSRCTNCTGGLSLPGSGGTGGAVNRAVMKLDIPGP